MPTQQDTLGICSGDLTDPEEVQKLQHQSHEYVGDVYLNLLYNE
jgi:hypothetical protein